MKILNNVLLSSILLLMTTFSVHSLLGQGCGETPGWGNYAITSATHFVFFPDTLISNINGMNIEVGDSLVVLYTDDDGNLVSGGSEEWTGESIAIVSYGDDGTTEEKDGFDPGEPFKIQLWQASTGNIFDLDATYMDPSISVVITSTDSFGNNGFSGVEEISFSGSGPSLVQVKTLLEGPYAGAGLMTSFVTLPIPSSQPYSTAPYNHSGSEMMDGFMPNVVDWVLVELRSGTPNVGGTAGTVVVESVAGLLLSDGNIVSPDNPKGLVFNNLDWMESYHIVVRHRNHLDVLSAESVQAGPHICYDFTSGVAQAFGTQQLNETVDGFPVMYSGDFNHDGTIQVSDYDLWFLVPAATNTYSDTDANVDGTVQVTDYDQWFFNKAKVGNIEIQF